MEGSASNKYKNCSLGMKQRIGIAMALMGKPKILISSHLLSELEKIATHYGIIRNRKMICELTAEQLEEDCPTYVGIRAADMERTENLLKSKYERVMIEKDFLRVYDEVSPEEIVKYLYDGSIIVSEVFTAKIGLEEYYKNLMGGRKYA